MYRLYLNDYFALTSGYKLLLKILYFSFYSLLSLFLLLPPAANFLYRLIFCNTFAFLNGQYKFCEKNWPNFYEINPPETIYDFFSVWITSSKAVLTTGNIYINLFSCAWLGYLILHLFYIRYSLLEEHLITKLSNEPPPTNKIIGAFKDGFLALSPLFSPILFIPFAYKQFQNIHGYEQYQLLQQFGLICSITLLASIFLNLPLLGTAFFKYRFKNAPVARRREILFSRLSEKIGQSSDYMQQEESLILEFKTSFQTPYPDGPKETLLENGQSYFTMGDDKRRYNSKKEIEKKLQDAVLEAVVGFLNASGGKLVIGINERNNKKHVVGTDFENFSSEDEYQRHVIQQIINRIGKNFMGEYIDTNFEAIEGKSIFVISVKPFIPVKGQIPALLDGLKCFKRTGPRTDPIDSGKEFAQFIIDRVFLAK